jgi:5-methyltetrahydrofolate--homocysteine methyltransferase
MSDTGFDEKPHDTSELLKEFADSGFVNIAGGCCGTTPDHIKAIANQLENVLLENFQHKKYSLGLLDLSH